MPESKVHTTDWRACGVSPDYPGPDRQPLRLQVACRQHGPGRAVGGQTVCLACGSAWQFDAYPSLPVATARLKHLYIHVAITGFSDRGAVQLQLQC